MILEEFSLHLRSNASPSRAKEMAAYMRDKFSYLGLSSTQRRDVLAPFKAQLKELSYHDFLNLICALWEEPEREFQYAAIDLWKWRKNKVQEDDIPLIETFIATKSWWDTVDLIASNIAGQYAMRYPNSFEPYRKKWIQSDNLWLNRSAMIYQLKHKDKLDEAKLTESILPHLNVNDQFIQKAIGWSLRQHSRVNHEWVMEFVQLHNIQGLAQREALRLIKD